jgi:hypothetical protein
MSSMICAMMQPGRWTNFSDPNLDPNRPQHHPTQSDPCRWGFPGNPLPSGHYPTQPNTLIPISHFRAESGLQDGPDLAHLCASWNGFTTSLYAILYTAWAQQTLGYKTLQACRWEKELVEYSRRLEEVAVVGRAGIRCDRIECFWSLLVPHRGVLAWRVQGVSLAFLLAADPAS